MQEWSSELAQSDIESLAQPNKDGKHKSAGIRVDEAKLKKVLKQMTDEIDALKAENKALRT